MSLLSLRRLCMQVPAGLAVMTACFCAHADDDASYVAGHAGRNTLERWPVQVDFGGPRADGELGLDRSYHLGLAAGRESGPWRYEVEYQYGRMKIESLALGGQAQSSGGSGHYETAMLNGYRSFQASERFKVFAGLGIGWGRVAFPESRFGGLGSSCDCFPKAHHDGFAYQGRLGVEYVLSPNHAVQAMYTRLHLDGGDAGGMPSTHYDKRWVGAASLGYRYTFR